MTRKKDAQQILREFTARQSRQLIAIAVTMFLVLLFAVLYKRPELFAEFSKSTLFGAQSLVIAAFIGFTSYNWSCPSCGKYLGNDIFRRACKKCGARFR